MTMRIILGISIALLILGSGHAFVASRLAWLVPGSIVLQKWIWAFTFVGFFLAIGSFFLVRGPLGNPLVDWALWLGYTWMGMALLFLTAGLVGDLVGILGWIGKWIASGLSWDQWVLIGRRALVLFSVMGGLWALWEARLLPRIHNVEVRIEGLPKEFDGYRIAHITDTHIGPILRTDWTRKLVESVNASKPDLIVHTGDLIDGSVERVRDFVEPMSKLQAKDGLWYVTGNHEAYHGALEWVKVVEQLGFHDLANAHTEIQRDSSRIVLAGITDAREGGMIPSRAPDPNKAFVGSPAGAIRILLAHQPVQASMVQGMRVSLMLSGHTHGGQIWPFRHLIQLQQPVADGFGMVGDVLVFVSRGAGFWGPPMRLFAPPEVPILVLRSK